MNTDKVVARILVVSLTLLAAIGLIGTLYLLATGTTDSGVSVYVALAGVPIGAVAALATTKTGSPTGAPEVIQGPNTENPFGTTVVTKTDAEKFTITVPKEEKKEDSGPIIGMGI